jgi:hypothetical protein
MAIHPKILAQIAKVTSKRPLAVINHIRQHGQVTTEQLREVYGYEHAPRARMDVLEWGIPLETVRVSNRAGTKKIAAYRFGDPDKVDARKTGGRQPFSKAFKKLLYERQQGTCAITGEPLEARYLSIDHRIPYQVAGDQVAAEDNPDAFMLISLGLQRVKSWSCENCPNGTVARDPKVCQRCFWAHPEGYDHIATQQRRRVDLVWIGEEIKEYEAIARLAKREAVSIQEFMKKLIRKGSNR